MKLKLKNAQVDRLFDLLQCFDSNHFIHCFKQIDEDRPICVFKEILKRIGEEMVNRPIEGREEKDDHR